MPGRVRTFQFAYCTRQGCRYSHERHLVVTKKEFDLSDEKYHETTIAISYTWGTSERVPQYIGHSNDEKNPKSVTLKLGSEWYSRGLKQRFINKLHRVCLPDSRGRPRYCWIDQLSINQGDQADVRDTLAQIPEIYRTFEVVALLPGAKCKCVTHDDVHKWPTSISVESSGHVDSDVHSKLQSGIKNPHVVQFQLCHNILGCASYFQRLWPRQELYYARKVRAIWASDEILECHSVGKNLAWDNAKRFVKASFGGLFGMLKGHTKEAFIDGVLKGAWGNPPDDGQPNICVSLYWQACLAAHIAEWPEKRLGYYFHFMVLPYCLMAFNDANSAMQAWSLMRNDAADDTTLNQDPRNRSLLAHFLNGHVLEKRDGRHNDENDTRRAREFLLMLQSLAGTNRECTRSHDLVRAVWCDCPFWEQPSRMNEQPLWELLDNAILQLESKWRISPISTLPSGFFDPKSIKPLLWKPSLCLSPSKEYKSTRVYGALSSMLLSEMLDMTKDPRFNIPRSASSGTRIYHLNDYGALTEDVLQFLCLACKNWTITGKARLYELSVQDSGLTVDIDYFLRSGSFNGEDFLKYLALVSVSESFAQHFNTLLGPHVGDLFRRVCDHPNVSAFAEEEETFQAVYRLVCWVLGLDFDSVKNDPHLRLMLDPGLTDEGIPPRIGLSRIPENTNPTTYTVCMIKPGRSINGVFSMLEVEVTEKGLTTMGSIPPSEFRILGIWIQPAKYGSADALARRAGCLIQGKTDVSGVE